MNCCSSCERGETGAHEPQCEFKDTALFGGAFFPRRKRCPYTAILEDVVRPFETVSDVPQTLVLTVKDGLCLVWLQSEKPAITDPADFEVGIDPLPFTLRLPPGQFTLWFGAGADVDLDFRATLIDAEAHA